MLEAGFDALALIGGFAFADSYGSDRWCVHCGNQPPSAAAPLLTNVAFHLLRIVAQNVFAISGIPALLDVAHVAGRTMNMLVCMISYTAT